VSATGYLAVSTPLRLSVGGTTVALPILAVEALGDVAVGGLLAAACLAPSILAAPFVGAWLDRTRHPRLLIALAGLVTALGTLVAAFLGEIPIALVALAVIAAGAMTPFFMGGLSSFATEEIRDERRAYALDALSYNLGSVAGPAVVAAASALGSARIAVVAMAVSAALGSAGTLLTRLRPQTDAPAESMRSAIVAGLRHIVRHRPIAVVTSSGTLSQLGSGGLAVAAVVLATERAGTPDQGAVIVAAFAIGGLVSALVIAARPMRMRAEWAMGTGFAATGVLTIVAAADLGMWWTTLLIGLSGLFTASSSAAMLLLRKQQSFPEVRSQVFTVGAGLRATAAAAGAALAGIAAGVGGAVLIVAIGAIWVVSAAIMLAYPPGTRPLDP
jgi:MFS family permease